jgi:steroid delta-isomerase-like uncharacterized protein
MSVENTALAERWMNDNWNNRDEKIVKATVAALLSPDIRAFMEGAEIKSAQDFLDARRDLIKGFPDVAMEIQERIGDRDVVALLWRVTGTHQGAYLGVPPTGKAIRIRGSTWFYFHDGKAILAYDTWNQGDLVNYLRGSRPARAARPKRKSSTKSVSRSARKSVSGSAKRPPRRRTATTKTHSVRKQASSSPAKTGRRARARR